MSIIHSSSIAFSPEVKHLHVNESALHRLASLDQLLVTSKSQTGDTATRPLLTGLKKLPPELLSEIVQQAPVETRAALHQVNREWRDVSTMYLRSLRLKDVSQLHSAMTTLPALTSLSIEEGRGVRDEHLASIVQHYPALQKLTIHHASQLSHAGIAHIEKLSGLHHLSLSGASIDDEALASVGTLTELAHLQLTGSQITGSGFHHLEPLTKLRSLDLTYAPITDAGLDRLPSLPLLVEITFSGCRSISEAAIRKFAARFAQLEHLDLHNTNVGDEGLHALFAAHAQPLLPNLSKLVLSQCSLTNDGLRSMSRCTSLAYLDLAGCSHINDDGMGFLKGLSRLESLDLTHCDISNDGLGSLQSLFKIQRLALTGTNVSDEGMECLKHLRNLQFLVLSFTDVSNSGLKSLLDLHELRFLGLNHCHNIDVPNLAALQRLRPRLVFDTANWKIV